MGTKRYDAVIIGGGHNSLIAAAYLAKEGYSVAVLERSAEAGGATASVSPWFGVNVRLSRYSYLVSLFPQQIIDDLKLPILLRKRRYGSYTPKPSDPATGLLVDYEDPAASAASFAAVTGDPNQYARYTEFSARTNRVAGVVFPSMTDPLVARSTVKRRLKDDSTWHDLVEQPIGQTITESMQDDVVRGVVATDALIGTFARLDDPSLIQNRCFLYHVIGGKTGNWDVPIGGMGMVAAAIDNIASIYRADIITSAEVLSVDPDGFVTARVKGEEVTFAGKVILSGVAPRVLAKLMGETPAADTAPEGSQVKVNMLLKRLPKLHDSSITAKAAFSGTFHINEAWSQLNRAYDEAAAGAIPVPLPAEVYCHSLTDPSILGAQLHASGAQTMTVFGLHVPDRLITPENNEAMRDELLAAVSASLDSVIAEPIADCLYVAPDGTPCIEARTTLDIERDLNMPGGNIFHGDLSWPWAEDDENLDTPAETWGVATAHERVLLCGAGARRGGAVSGIGGHNAAMAALEILSED